MWALTAAIDRLVLVALQRPGKVDAWFASCAQIYDLHTAPIVAIYATADYGNGLYKPLILSALVLTSAVMEFMLLTSAESTRINAIALVVHRLETLVKKGDTPSEFALLGLLSSQISSKGIARFLCGQILYKLHTHG